MCSSAHYWARQARSYGHEVRLIAPQFVKPFDGLSDRCRAELWELAGKLRHLDRGVDHYDAQIEALAHSHPQAQVLMTIPDLGAKGATVLAAAVGEDPRLFRNGRGLAAWLELALRQHSTGGCDR